ncbi:MAG: DUF29 family protein [Pleurocapsa sp. MO_226.B13]|nr:DUF29 family protein [Pleurocapsa sp. MO_226.B13]
MEEILELKEKLYQGDIAAAIAICDELETMGRQDKINTLESFLVVIIIHLIKIQVENRVTASWIESIRNSLLEIKDRNQLGKKSHYIKRGGWSESYENKLYRAIIKASKEVAGGMEIKDLKAKINHEPLKNKTLDLLDLIYTSSEEEIVESLNEESLLL